MTSFFEKLKKGMGVGEVEEPIIEETIGEEDKSPSSSFSAARITKTKTGKRPKKSPKLKDDKTLNARPAEQVKKIEIQTEMPKEAIEGEEKEKSPFARAEEGQLAIDVYQSENDLVIQSTIAGVRPESLDISMERDIITIRGSREKPFEENGDYFVQECFWGPFSREVILPAEVDPGRAAAEMKNGILTIRIPKILREKKRRIAVSG